MAHKTLIGGTAYEIKGGKTLIDGTAYSIKSGRTLVDGTGYEINFLVSFTFYVKSSVNNVSEEIYVEEDPRNPTYSTWNFSDFIHHASGTEDFRDDSQYHITYKGHILYSNTLCTQAVMIDNDKPYGGETYYVDVAL